MANRFNRPARHTEINGAAVCAMPIAWRHVRAGIAAEAAGDSAALLAVMAEAVRESVRYADGSPVDPDELDCGTIAALFKFASGSADGNFTPPASTASPAVAAATDQPVATPPPT